MTERLSIQEIIDHCDRQLKREPVGSIFYREHEAVKAYLLELLQFRSIDENPAKLASQAELYMESLTRTYGPVKQKIDEWLEADQSGRLEVLPCKIGDWIYALWDVPTEYKYVIYCAEVKEIRHSVRNCRATTTYRLEPIEYRGRIKEYRDDDFGKTVFLSSEEAEAALQKVKSGLLADN